MKFIPFKDNRDGPLREEILKFNLKNVTYLGKLENKKVLEEISKSQYLIQPSILYENLWINNNRSF